MAPALVGVPELNYGPGRPLFNSTMLLRSGHVAARFRKSLLPTYDVFDEDRYFEPGDGVGIVDIDGRRVAVSVCEDVWGDEVTAGTSRRYAKDPLRPLEDALLDCFINVSASPFVVGKQQVRERLLADIARRLHAPVVYANQVGGNDDLVFDGRSVVFGADGRLSARAAAFAEETLVVGAGVRISRELSPEEELCEALGSDAVEGVLMPSPWTSQSSLDDAFELAERLGMRTRVLPIAPLMDACDTLLAPEFAGRPRDTTEENIQARLRGTLLMALANLFFAVPATT